MYNKFEDDTGHVYLYDATPGAAGYKHEEPNYNMQMVCHIEEEEDADGGNLINIGVFKPTSGNETKWLRMQQETRRTTKTMKVAKTPLKQIAS